jgi:16S rRNA (guanine527-N7)-methyltransferase
LAYLSLLQKLEQATYNLTAVRDPAGDAGSSMCWTVWPPCRRCAGTSQQLGPTGARPRVLDVGSRAAACPAWSGPSPCPEADIVCVDTVGKKAAFIRAGCRRTLGLANLHGIGMRASSSLADAPFDLITSRAFASLVRTSPRLTRQRAGGRQGVLAGDEGQATPTDELSRALGWPTDVRCFTWNNCSVPGLDAERCLVWLKPVILVTAGHDEA